MNKILIICETIDFQNFTRRSTTEALAQLENVSVEALMNTNIHNIFKVDRYSNFLNVRCLFYIFQKRIANSIFAKIEIILLSILWRRFCDTYDIVMFTSPNQDYLLPLFKNQKKIFLISDPYHLMGKTENMKILASTQRLYNHADAVLVTAQNLKDIYIPKYIKDKNQKVIHYWPNTVDTSIWDYEKYCNCDRSNSNSRIGFIGNFMNVTDIVLLDFITTQNPSFSFILAGKISYKYDTAEQALLKAIFDRPNVNFVDFIPYNKIPELVITFSVGILLDKKTELASYHHHNKLYQYLALGKPVVTLDYLDDYNTIENGVYIASSYEEYNEHLLKAVAESKTKKIQKEIVAGAYNNNSLVRANQLLAIIDNMKNVFS